MNKLLGYVKFSNVSNGKLLLAPTGIKTVIAKSIASANASEVREAAPSNNHANAPEVTEAGPSNNQRMERDKLYRLVEVEVRGNDPAVLKSYSWFATTAARELGIRVGECWAPRKAHHDRMTLLKSVHIYKKHRVQYEIRTYFRFMQFFQLTGSTSDTFTEYIQRNLPEGVAMKVTKVGLETLPQHLVTNS